MLDKLAMVQTRGIEAVKIAVAEGVPVAFGTDLLGHMHDRQNGEFRLRTPAMSPLRILQSATFDAARLMRQEAHIGQLVPGAYADLLIVDGDPTQDADVLAEPEANIRLLMKGGAVVYDRR
jgi:imidazolonepropionase-like amidohydrolase